MNNKKDNSVRRRISGAVTKGKQYLKKEGLRLTLLAMSLSNVFTAGVTSGINRYENIQQNKIFQQQADERQKQEAKAETQYHNQVYKNMKALKQLMDNCKIVVDDRIQNDNREELLTLMDKDDRLKDYTYGLKRLNKMTIYQDEQPNLYTDEQYDGISYYQYYNESVGYGGPYDEEYSEEMWHPYYGKGAAYNMMSKTSWLGNDLIDLVSDIAHCSQPIFSARIRTILEYKDYRYSSSKGNMTYTQYYNDKYNNRLYVKFLPSDKAACEFDDGEGRNFVKFDDEGKPVFTYGWFAPRDMEPGNVVGVCFPNEEFQQDVLEEVGLSENITESLNQFTQMRSQDDIINAEYQFNTLRCALLNKDFRNYINEEAEKLKKDKEIETDDFYESISVSPDGNSAIITTSDGNRETISLNGYEEPNNISTKHNESKESIRKIVRSHKYKDFTKGLRVEIPKEQEIVKRATGIPYQKNARNDKAAR